jgi:hypothetical protein
MPATCRAKAAFPAASRSSKFRAATLRRRRWSTFDAPR